MTDRRQFLAHSAGMLAWATLANAGRSAEPVSRTTRGVVLLPEDLSLTDWPARAKTAGLTTIAIHHQNSPQAVIDWLQQDPGQKFQEACRKLGLAVEFELHAMKELLPRRLFARNPELFRLNDKGERVPDANCCAHSKPGLAIIAENAVALARKLRPSTSRHFFWGDDGQPWCQCTKCKELSPAEQALLVENEVATALRSLDANACLAHLAYLNTLKPPMKIKPHPGIFLEFAPINRRYDIAYERQSTSKNADGLEALDANLQVFPRETAQVLEYWLDVSRFSRWKRPAVKLPWNKDVFAADVAAYRKRGIRHLTSFAAWLDADYVRRFGDLEFLGDYGAGLSKG